jgi:hypothetical protein
MLHLYIVGDSHIGCLDKAFREASKFKPKPHYSAAFHSLGGGAVAYDLLIRNHQSCWVLNPLLKTAVMTAKKQATRITPADRVQIAICVGGYVSTVYTWDKKLGQFDFLLDAEDSVDADPDALSMMVPTSLVRQSLKAHFKVMVDALLQVKQQTALPTLFVSPPPPYRSSETIVELMCAKRSIDKHAMQQPMHSSVRLKVWRIADEILRAEMERISVPFLGVPSGAVDADGYLLPEMFGDGFHAGTAYGQLVLDALVQHAETEAAFVCS